MADRTQPAARDTAVGWLLWGRMPRSGTIGIGPGHAGLQLAQAITADPPPPDGLIVVTNALDTEIALAPIRTITVYTVGGRVRWDNRAQEGAWAIDELRRLQIDVALISPDGIDPVGGLTCDDMDTATVTQALLSTAHRVIWFGDRRTVGRTSFVRFAAAAALSEVVTPAGLPPHARDALDVLRQQGVAVTSTSG